MELKKFGKFLACLAFFVTFAFAQPTSVTEELPSNSTRLEKRLGINCRGSAMCLGCGHYLNRLLDMASFIENDAEYPENKRIVCGDCRIPFTKLGICAFTQNMEGKKIKGSVVREKLLDIYKHGCRACGSVPVYPGNNVDLGEVTVNWVTNSCGLQVC
ncbi:killer toxin [Aaosphaeria arxii CBS 175.79]|uniref:Killer toxin n=1 Tax=Aaosphaeria arxii CBS 175.79 TaxID=1450172 RepID=A0A6A5XDE9_9PLEO|nr:killer toxin [Aaosphaeria arxii CBS 175.79]KAF2011032.1 killer toxin [Aaosphaeria arxii CBS 175.79]